MTITRSVLRRALQSTDEFSYRQARQIVSIIIDVLTKSLKEQGSLELPFGSLTIKRPIEGRDFRLGKIVRTGRKIKVHFKKEKSNV